ncbi:uncharacterized protein KD926_010391 [Aspergillus affinis]|uniref:uncharacterized protein n=1 Tax=Aspergillus affinis TaxID=1070780 RepID=UPI0022FDF9CC|nr:uncharacterized protein KD926_010391 [Aspergillus affinis]KAI9045068.1 hypothetical protein KD926_010391 [Aspergillus affinis]
MLSICKWAFGKHEGDVSQELLTRALKLYFIAQILYKINIGLTKISILLLYLRLFIQRWFFITCWAWIVIITAFTLGTVISSIFQCSPVQYAFDKSLPGSGSCINLTAFWYANAGFNIFSDLVLVALPVPVISRLQLPPRLKLILCGISPLRLHYIYPPHHNSRHRHLLPRHHWNSINSSKWTVIGSNLGIICACLPALRRPLAFLFPHLFGKFSRNANYAAADRQATHSRAGRPNNSSDPSRRKFNNRAAFNKSVSRYVIHTEKQGSTSQEQILPDAGEYTKEGIERREESFQTQTVSTVGGGSVPETQAV